MENDTNDKSLGVNIAMIIDPRRHLELFCFLSLKPSPRSLLPLFWVNLAWSFLCVACLGTGCLDFSAKVSVAISRKNKNA